MERFLKTFKKGIVGVLITTIAVGYFANIPYGMTNVSAEENNTTGKNIAGFGTEVIVDPTMPTSSSDAWKGSYVYFGTYNDSPVKYRVLDSETTVFGGNTMLLDCDTILWAVDNNPSSAFDASSHAWENSDIREYLNGTFLNGGNFTVLEQNAIVSSIKDEADHSDGAGSSSSDYVVLTGDKIFFLDAKEATNTSYGYNNTVNSATNRIKTGGYSYWWLRTAYSNFSDNAHCVDIAGYISSYEVSSNNVGVSPALNVNLSSVLFSSVVSGTAGETGTEYKLTLLDNDMTITGNGAVTRNGSTVTIPYAISGADSANATQVSVVLLDKEYTAGNTNNAEILFYGALNDDNSFTLPSDLSDKVCGRDYYAYIVAEDVNGTYETDYASAPEKISIPWTSKSMNFGINGIIDPIVPTSTSDAWTGSYVYFGIYNGNPVKYRVLDSNTSVFGGTTMLLDCDTVLWEGIDNPSSKFDSSSNIWADSDIRAYLNGEFLTDNFSTLEQNSIAESSKNTIDSSDGEGWINLSFAPLNDDRIFLLDAMEVTNTSYGYSNTDNDTVNRTKTGNSNSWRLRSPYIPNTFVSVGRVSATDGYIGHGDVYYGFGYGISPALNLEPSSILFSSASGTSKSLPLTANSNAIGTTTVAEWKLTLSDNRKTVQLIDDEVVYKASNGTIKVPFTYTDTATTDAEKVNQISVMITDKVCTEADAQILYYGALQGTDFTATSGTGTFELPTALDGKAMGVDYHIYILVEHVNTTNATDYASAPMEITDIFDEVNGFDIEVDAPVADTALDTSATASSEIETAVVTWINGESTVTGNAGYNTAYTVKITLTAIDGYVITENTDITINGNAVTALKNNDGTITVSYTFPVTEMGAITHTAIGYEGTYDGNEHSITVNVGDLDGATITYSLDTGDNKAYSATKPTFTDAGTYTVYYKIEKENYETITGSMTVKITAASDSTEGDDTENNPESNPENIPENNPPTVVDPNTGFNMIAVIAPIFIVALGGVIMIKRRRIME